MEYSNIVADIKGFTTIGRLSLTAGRIIFESKTGKVNRIVANDMASVNYQRFGGFFGLRIFMKNGNFHRYTGFKSVDERKIIEFFKNTYHKDSLEKELSLKGWNWGRVHFTGSLLKFDCDEKNMFEIPLQHVSQCTIDNEVTIEFHPNDAPVSLMEMRMHIPTESSDMEPLDEFRRSCIKQSLLKSMSDDAIAIFKGIQCLTPRGHYDIKIFRTFFHLHGKTYDYKIRMSTIVQLFLLPHKDNRQIFFVLSLDPPIKQGQTSYHHLVLLFAMKEQTNIELKLTKTELKQKYRLEKKLSGPLYEVFGKVSKAFINRKLTRPGNFIGHTGTWVIDCSYKEDVGYLYPLEKAFMYVHKPPIYIRFDEIASVYFARIGSSVSTTRSFDFQIEDKYQTEHTFSSIANEEYSKLFNFVNITKLQVKNTGSNNKSNFKNYFGDSKNVGDSKYENKQTEGSLIDNLLHMMDKDRPFKPPICDSPCNTPSPAASPTPSFSSSDEMFTAFQNKFTLPEENPPYRINIPSLFDINVEMNW